MDIFTVVIGLASKLMDKLPDYDQQKKQKFFKLKKRLTVEWAKPYPQRDDDLILNIKDEMTVFLESFYKEIM